MTNAFQLRTVITYVFVVLLAILVGFFVSQPDSPGSLAIIGAIVFAGCLPLLMKWHHLLLVATWNAALNAFFLPGQPDLWMFMAIISLCLCLWKRSVSREFTFTLVPSVWWPLFLLGVIVVGTALSRGGVGLQSFGASSIGARRYVSLLAAIIGFVALSSQKIPPKRALLYGSLFFLSGVTAAMSDIIYFAGPKLYFLYYLFPSQLARLQATHDILAGNTLFRLEGVASASLAFSCFMLVRYGVRELLDLRRPWRIIIFALAVGVGLLGGFRGRLFLTAMFFIVQFCLEGLWRTRWVPILLGVGLLVAAAVLPFTEKLPESFQRTLSFLPVQVSPNVKRDAEDTVVWRVEMWRALWPEVPKYFWLGKGYAFSATDLYLTELAQAQGLAKDYESMMLVSEYHNGPLSVIIPFGIWGLIVFVWFIIAGWWVLYRNYRYGEHHVKKVNTFMLTYYSVMTFFFFTIYGALNTQLFFFTGAVGLSLALNRGVKTKKFHLD